MVVIHYSEQDSRDDNYGKQPISSLIFDDFESAESYVKDRGFSKKEHKYRKLYVLYQYHSEIQAEIVEAIKA